MRRASSYPCSGPSCKTLSTASSAVPRLIPEPIIACPLTYRILIYKPEIVNCSEVQVWQCAISGQPRLGSCYPEGRAVCGLNGLSLKDGFEESGEGRRLN